jgi:hypothetical protein
MRLFADKVLPTLQHDKAFATPKQPSADVRAAAPADQEGIFAPA